MTRGKDEDLGRHGGVPARDDAGVLCNRGGALVDTVRVDEITKGKSRLWCREINRNGKQDGL